MGPTSDFRASPIPIATSAKANGSGGRRPNQALFGELSGQHKSQKTRQLAAK
jgi:hypothetical protein